MLAKPEIRRADTGEERMGGGGGAGTGRIAVADWKTTTESSRPSMFLIGLFLLALAVLRTTQPPKNQKQTAVQQPMNPNSKCFCQNFRREEHGAGNGGEVGANGIRRGLEGEVNVIELL